MTMHLHEGPSHPHKQPEWKTWSFWLAVGSLVVSAVFGFLTYLTNENLAVSAGQSAQDSHASANAAERTLQIQSEPVLLLECDWVPVVDNGIHAFNWRHRLIISPTQTLEVTNNVSGTFTQIGPFSAKNTDVIVPPSPTVFFNCALANYGPLPLIKIQLGDFIPYFLKGPAPTWAPGNPGSIAEIPVLERGESYKFSIVNGEQTSAKTYAPTTATVLSSGRDDRFSVTLIPVGVTDTLQDFTLPRYEVLPPLPKAWVSPSP